MSKPPSLMCEPPEETLVCEAPPAPPAPAKSPVKPKPSAPSPPKDAYKAPPAATGSSSSSFGFLDEENGVCRAPEQLLMPQPSARLDPALFSSTLANSHMVAELDLEITDRDGIQKRSQQDIEGVIHSGNIAVNRELFAPALNALKGTTQENKATHTTTQIKNVRFDAKDKAYVLDLEVTKKFWKVPVWDNFEVRVQPNSHGELAVKLDKNWFPDEKILSQLEATIRDQVRQRLPQQDQLMRLETEQKGNQLTLRPQLKQLDIPLGQVASLRLEHMDSSQAKLRFDPEGHLQVELKDVKVSGSSTVSGPAGSATSPDQARLQVKLGVGKDGSREALTQGQISVQLDESETPEIRMGHDRLGDFLKSGELQADFGLYVKQTPGKAPVLQSASQVEIKNADLGHSQKTHLKTSLQLDFDAQGIQLKTLAQDYAPLEPQTTRNGVQFFVNGQEYYPEMKRLIGAAKESIALETFMFTEDKVGLEVADLLARKAAGLDPGKTGVQLQSDKGVDVRFIFNSWKGNLADGEASSRMLEEARSKVRAEIEASGLSPAQKQQATANLERNLNWTFFTEGLLRSDHRKVLVVDGAQATVGGMNIGENYLSDHGYHDVMLKVAGPEVRQIHKEFLENWYEFRHTPKPDNWEQELKSSRELRQDLTTRLRSGEYQSKAQLQTLVTDDQQVDIERGLVHLIDHAEREINIEQAFFSDETINAHLAKALERGVKINVVVAEQPLAEGVFSAANLLSVYELAQKQLSVGKGEVNLHYYSHPEGGKQGQIHAKAIAVDGQRAIVGSANMIGRSLSSPFLQQHADGQTSQALYNKELSLLLEGEEVVQQIEQRLFQKDLVERTRRLNAQEILKEVEKAGGEAELRKKAVAAPFT